MHLFKVSWNNFYNSSFDTFRKLHSLHPGDNGPTYLTTFPRVIVVFSFLGSDVVQEGRICVEAMPRRGFTGRSLHCGTVRIQKRNKGAWKSLERGFRKPELFNRDGI